jgi:polysaccharide chain length determinant protein (PEP-CTERM system associated)
VTPQEIIAEVLDQLRGMWRFRWWAAAIAWAISLGGWLYVYSIPDVYRASARVYVDTNSLIQPIFRGLTPAGTNTLNEVQLVSTAVLTRPNLERIARKTELDVGLNTPAKFDTLVTSLQKRITVAGRGDNIFLIQYEDSNRDVARTVVTAVLDTFVGNAIGAQGNDAEITEKAVKGEIDEHEQRLRSAEVALAEFKKENLGFMPGESGDYYNRLQTALNQVAASEERIRQLEQRRDELKRQIEGEEPVFGLVSDAGATGTVSASCSESGRLADLQGQLSKLLVDFTEKHPRVVTLQETINVLEARCAQEHKTAQASGRVVRPAGEEPLEQNPVYQNLRIQLSNAEVELAEVHSQQKSYQDTVATLRRDVDKIAEVEAQLKQLNRDYDVIQSRHQELLRRWEDLQAKKRLDPVTDKVQFRRIEPPFALPDPIGPNRPALLGIVLVFALGAGAAIAFAVNQLKPVYFSRRGLQRHAGVPVLGSISLQLSPSALARSRVAAITWVGAYVLLFAFTGLVIVFASRGSQLLHSLTAGVMS